MDDLITQGFSALLKSAPITGFILVVIYLARKEIAALLTAGRGDGKMETLTTKMVDLFERNLEYFGAVAVHTENMQAALRSIDRTTATGLLVQQGLKEEIIRQGRSGK